MNRRSFFRIAAAMPLAVLPSHADEVMRLADQIEKDDPEMTQLEMRVRRQIADEVREART